MAANPHRRVRISWAIVVVCLVSWPMTSLTIFKGGCDNAAVAQGFLALSWIALIATFVVLAITTEVQRSQGEGDGPAS